MPESEADGVPECRRSEDRDFLQSHYSITIVDKVLIEADTVQMYNVPGKLVKPGAYNNKTDIVFCFYSGKGISYSYCDQDEQRSEILQRLSGEGWRTRELLEEFRRSRDFYSDKMYQMKKRAIRHRLIRGLMPQRDDAFSPGPFCLLLAEPWINESALGQRNLLSRADQAA